MPFWRSVFSDGDQGSFSRVASGFLIVCAAWWISVYLVVSHPHRFPTAATLLALGGFCGMPYGWNQVKGAVAAGKVAPGSNH